MFLLWTEQSQPSEYMCAHHVDSAKMGICASSKGAVSEAITPVRAVSPNLE